MTRIYKVLQQALTHLSSHGYIITKKVRISVDPQLPFMGYTTSDYGQTQIVVSRWALDSPMLMGLVIHELSHVYRTQEAHPSHNFALLNHLLSETFVDLPVSRQHEEILHKIINHLQDIYADDISFQVYISDSLPQKYLTDFFLDWIKIPGFVKKSGITNWHNAEAVISTAFAAANADRHLKNIHVLKNPKILEFIRHISPQQNKMFKYFYHFMVSLPDPVSDSEYTKLLTEYLHHFLSLVQTFTP